MFNSRICLETWPQTVYIHYLTESIKPQKKKTWCFIDNLSPEMKQDNHLLGIQFLLHTFQTTWKCFRLQWGMREASLLWHVRERIAFLYHFTKVIEQGFLFSRSILYWHLTATWEEILCWRKERYIREFLHKLKSRRRVAGKPCAVFFLLLLLFKPDSCMLQVHAPCLGVA